MPSPHRSSEAVHALRRIIEGSKTETIEAAAEESDEDDVMAPPRTFNLRTWAAVRRGIAMDTAKLEVAKKIAQADKDAVESVLSGKAIGRRRSSMMMGGSMKGGGIDVSKVKKTSGEGEDDDDDANQDDEDDSDEGSSDDADADKGEGTGAAMDGLDEEEQRAAMRSRRRRKNMNRRKQSAASTANMAKWDVDYQEDLSTMRSHIAQDGSVILAMAKAQPLRNCRGPNFTTRVKRNVGTPLPKGLSMDLIGTELEGMSTTMSTVGMREKVDPASLPSTLTGPEEHPTTVSLSTYVGMAMRNRRGRSMSLTLGANDSTSSFERSLMLGGGGGRGGSSTTTLDQSAKGALHESGDAYRCDEDDHPIMLSTVTPLGAMGDPTGAGSATKTPPPSAKPSLLGALRSLRLNAPPPEESFDSNGNQLKDAERTRLLEKEVLEAQLPLSSAQRCKLLKDPPPAPTLLPTTSTEAAELSPSKLRQHSGNLDATAAAIQLGVLNADDAAVRVAEDIAPHSFSEPTYNSHVIRQKHRGGPGLLWGRLPKLTVASASTNNSIMSTNTSGSGGLSPSPSAEDAGGVAGDTATMWTSHEPSRVTLEAYDRSLNVRLPYRDNGSATYSEMLMDQQGLLADVKAMDEKYRVVVSELGDHMAAVQFTFMAMMEGRFMHLEEEKEAHIAASRKLRELQQKEAAEKIAKEKARQALYHQRQSSSFVKSKSSSVPVPTSPQAGATRAGVGSGLHRSTPNKQQGRQSTPMSRTRPAKTVVVNAP